MSDNSVALYNSSFYYPIPWQLKGEPIKVGPAEQVVSSTPNAQALEQPAARYMPSPNTAEKAHDQWCYQDPSKACVRQMNVSKRDASAVHYFNFSHALVKGIVGGGAMSIAYAATGMAFPTVIAGTVVASAATAFAINKGMLPDLELDSAWAEGLSTSFSVGIAIATHLFVYQAVQNRLNVVG